MRHTILLATITVLCASSCGKTENKDKGGNTTNTANTAKTNGPTDGAKHSDDNNKAPMMTHTDTSPAAWKEAEAIAAKASVGQLEKRSDALPFLFMADAPAAVLVHQGAVVTAKGAAAAGAYLRDLGIVDGSGPGIEDVLFVLFAFDAWPPVQDHGAHKEQFINSPGDPSLAELTARVDMETEAAHVVLHYWLPEPTPPPEDLENDVGSIDPDSVPVVVRPVLRTTLVIPRAGAAAWKPVEKLNWALE